MGDSLFYKLGRMTGPAARKGRWMWNTLVGSEDDEIDAENAVGRDLADEMKQQCGVHRDPQSVALLDSLAGPLVARVRDRRRTFTFTVIGGDAPNAFALPGGHVFVNRPLLELCDWDPEETAFVLGHEMAHVIRRHAIGRVLRNSAVSVAARAVPGGAGTIAGWVRGAGVRLLQQAYSRENELDADELGARIAVAAGASPEAPARLLQRLASASTDSASDQPPLAEYFASHPPFAERIRHIDRLAL